MSHPGGPLLDYNTLNFLTFVKIARSVCVAKVTLLGPGKA